MIPELRPRGCRRDPRRGRALVPGALRRVDEAAAIVVIPVKVLIIARAAVGAARRLHRRARPATRRRVRQPTPTQLVALAAIVTSLFISAVMTTFVSAATTRIVADAYVGQPDDGQTSTDVRRRAVAVGRADDRLVRRRVRRLRRSASSRASWLQVAWSVAIPVFILERTGVFKALGRSFELTKAQFWLAFGVVWLSQLLDHACSASDSRPGSAGSSSRATAPRPTSSRSR